MTSDERRIIGLTQARLRADAVVDWNEGYVRRPGQARAASLRMQRLEAAVARRKRVCYWGYRCGWVRGVSP